jgi:hypothetical protein
VFDSAGLAAYASGSPGQVLGWLPSGALGALSLTVWLLVPGFLGDLIVPSPAAEVFVGSTWV